MRTVLFVCLSFAALASFAKTVHAPLPPELMQAKTIYILNESGAAALSDKCYSELTEWGRFKIVNDPKAADLVFRISTASRTTGYHADTNSDGDTSHTNIRANVASQTTIEVIQSSSGQILWSDSKAWGGLYTGFRSATKSVVKDLRKRIDEQEKK